jgi:hypothetical protein
MGNISEYKVMMANTEYSISNIITEALKNGYELYGTLQATSVLKANGFVDTNFCQAVIKYDPNTALKKAVFDHTA